MNRSYKTILRSFILMILFAYQNVSAQLSHADSIFFLTHFEEPMYVDYQIYPGDWYVHQPVVSMNDLYAKIDTIFKYKNADFVNSYENLILSSPLYFDTLINATNNYYYAAFGNAFQQNDPLVKLDFSLNGISSTSYAGFTESPIVTNNEIGFLIIPGSNINQTSEIMLGQGYHNANCYVRDNLLNYGDVYVHCKPLEDYRALTWNGYKFSSSDYNTPGLRYVYDYLDSIGKPYGTNYLIECLAMIKYMNTKYKKVILLGCSLGGYSTLIASFNSITDASIISSGYTKNIENDVDFIFELTQNFDSLAYQFDSITVRNSIQKSKSDYFFTWPDFDSYWYQLEHDSGYTEAFFNGLTNCSYYYDYEYHTFPQCYPIDTFLIKILNKPKLFYQGNYNGTADSMYTTIEFSGSGPFSFDIYRDGIFYKSYVNELNTIHDTLFKEGLYTIRNIVNSSGLIGTTYDSIQFTPNSSSASSFITNNLKCKVYPNPFHNQLQIELSNTIKELESTILTIRSEFGSILYQSKLNQNINQIDTRCWPNGVYFISIDTDDKHFNQKFLKVE